MRSSPATDDVAPPSSNLISQPSADSFPRGEAFWQLYRKYALTEEEITFIESHVKEMS